MFKHSIALFFALLLTHQVMAADVYNPQPVGRWNPMVQSHIGDSRTSLMLTAAPSSQPTNGAALTAQNWWNHANAYAGHRYQLGINLGASGCRTDQYLSSSNFNPLLTDTAGTVIFGLPAVNDIGAAGNQCLILPNGGSWPIVSQSGPYAGQSIYLANIATEAVANIAAAANQLVAEGKRVILTEERGQAVQGTGSTSFNNTQSTQASFTGSISAATLTVTAVSSGVIWPDNHLVGTGVTGTPIILAQLTGTGGNPCPDPTCTNGAGTYSINVSQSTIASEAMTTTYSTIEAMYEFNLRLRAYCNATPGCYIWSMNSVFWDPAGSSSAVSFNANFTVDGIHGTSLGEDAAGKAFNTFWESTFPVSDLSLGNSYFFSGARNLMPANPLYETLTGGTTSGCGTVTGNIPNNWALNCHSTSTNVTITSAVSTWCGTSASCGNDITIAMSNASAADPGVVFEYAAAGNTNGWQLTDWIQGGADVSVTAASNAQLFFATQAVTSVANSSQYDMYPNSTTVPIPAPYTWRLQSRAYQAQLEGGTKSFLLPNTIEVLIGSGGGSMTYTVNRPWAARMFNYSNGAFSGN